ncbi:hypothetical protein KCP77_19470 [Salmonella enterica subsp. enterica]|nr:hypothetical protein KCP77_19470 [Salmonella enterica subsp. enterica]
MPYSTVPLLQREGRGEAPRGRDFRSGNSQQRLRHSFQGGTVIAGLPYDGLRRYVQLADRHQKPWWSGRAKF